MAIDRHIPGLNDAKAKAAGSASGEIRRGVDLTTSVPQTGTDTQEALVGTEKSTWRPANGVQSAGWKRPSGFPDYWHDPTPPKE